MRRCCCRGGTHLLLYDVVAAAPLNLEIAVRVLKNNRLQVMELNELFGLDLDK